MIFYILFLRRYRSFFNLPQSNATSDQVAFAHGDFQFNLTNKVQSLHSGLQFLYEGSLVGGDRNSPGKFWQLTVNATESVAVWQGNAISQIAIDAYGIDGTISQGWRYTYIGAQVPAWQNR